MNERLKEIEERIGELETLQKPLYNEEFDLERERERIHAQAVKEIALKHSWILHYDDRRQQFYLEPEWTKPPISEKIYKHTGGSYHHSFLLEGKDKYDPFETVKLHIGDSAVSIWFNSTEMVKKHAFKFKIDMSKIEKTKKDLQEKLDILKDMEDHLLKGD